MKKWFISITFLLFFYNASSQEKVFYGGFFPEMAISHSYPNKLQTTFKVESSHIQFDDSQGETMQWKYIHYRTDLQGFIGIKFNPFWKASIGYQYRIEGDGPDSHRAIQQVGFIQNSPRIRFSHRLRLDQTFSTGDEDHEYRIRYRFASEIPLDGQTLNPGEFYLLLSNEIIFGTQSGESEIENRLVGSLGYYFDKKAKLEGGLDWRTDKFIAEGFRNRLWFKVGCYLSL